MRHISTFPAAAMVLGLAATGLLLTAPAASADGLPAPTVSKSTVTHGETFVVSGRGCVEDIDDSWVRVIVSGFTAMDVTPAPDGSWSVTDTETTTFAGSYPVRAKCAHSDVPDEAYPTVMIKVDAPPQWWQTCGPVPGSPGVTGCPGPPNLSVPTPSAQRSTPPRTPAAPTTTPHSTTPPTVAPPAALSSTVPPSATALPTTSGAATPPSPAAGCRDCARLDREGHVAAGDRLELSYTGFQPGEQVRLVLHSTPVELGTSTADASGSVSASVTIPAAVEAGSHTLTLSGDRTGERVVRFQLAAAAADRSEVDPARGGGGPGAGSLALAVGGVVVLLAMGGAVLVRRRRSGRPAPSPSRVEAGSASYPADTVPS